MKNLTNAELLKALKVVLEYFKTLVEGNEKITTEAMLTVIIKELDARGVYQNVFA